ncbi:hypothetical protein HID58_049111 [Brassica napus]|uniref:Uncharacterized protein n=1 Tax=Brassica napus TaxID=3708 RepID=A0ABQ8B511_BRANA|nr:hypothetical protein HID58_049111 [Brassica napus]
MQMQNERREGERILVSLFLSQNVSIFVSEEIREDDWRVNTPRKRKLRSDSAAEVAVTEVSTPMKWKSHRRCAVSSPRTPITEVEKESNGKLFDCLDVKSKWNPRACTEQKKAGSLYICGCPGTGNSLPMEKVRQQAEDWAKQEGLPCLETVYVNCTSLTKTIDIFSKILGENETGKKAVASSSPLQQLQIMFSQKQQSPSLKMILFASHCNVRRAMHLQRQSMGRHCFVDINSLNFLFMYQLYVVSNFIPRYRVEIFVYGNGDNASFVLLGDSGAESIGREVSELMDNYGEANGGNGKSSNPAISCDEENKANHPHTST